LLIFGHKSSTPKEAVQIGFFTKEVSSTHPAPTTTHTGFFIKEALSGCYSKSAVFPNQGNPCSRVVAPPKQQ
jgi:hypothetical protein